MKMMLQEQQHLEIRDQEGCVVKVGNSTVEAVCCPCSWEREREREREEEEEEEKENFGFPDR